MFFLKASSIRCALPDPGGNCPFFHLIRSLGSTKAARAKDASEHAPVSVLHIVV